MQRIELATLSLMIYSSWLPWIASSFTLSPEPRSSFVSSDESHLPKTPEFPYYHSYCRYRPLSHYPSWHWPWLLSMKPRQLTSPLVGASKLPSILLQILLRKTSILESLRDDKYITICTTFPALLWTIFSPVHLSQMWTQRTLRHLELEFLRDSVSRGILWGSPTSTHSIIIFVIYLKALWLKMCFSAIQ